MAASPTWNSMIEEVRSGKRENKKRNEWTFAHVKTEPCITSSQESKESSLSLLSVLIVV